MAINHLAMMKAVSGDPDRVKRIVKMVGDANSVPGHPVQRRLCHLLRR
ncbi:hypothetical protein H1W37_12270 [Stappia taiwanensis]|uniref:Uncharacterized protein n=1 Tax=Stappia taiwanensis TaxID=992267 RepID=A0A838XZJ9_9HYPH|nr:hypothetical protein [Stappia taiwanensis]MBA4612434.1 hypothetical protein [Stappia taiwanensis]